MSEERKFRKIKRAVIKEEFLAVTGDTTEAIILNQMLYWSERVSDYDKFLQEEQRRLLEMGKADNTPAPLCGWIYKSAPELKDEIMSMDSPKTIGRKLQNLVDKGFLSRRNNPGNGYDRTYQYRVNFSVLLAALRENGYALEGWVELQNSESAPAASESDSSSASGQRVPSNGQNDRCKGQNVPCKGQNDLCMGHGVPAIPEITPETTSEITSSPSYSPTAGTGPARRAAEEDGTDMQSVFSAIGVENIKHSDYIPTVKALLAQFWQTCSCGRKVIPVREVHAAIKRLTPDVLDSILAITIARTHKGQVAVPEEYIKALVMKGQNSALDALIAKDAAVDGVAPTYDMDDYVRMSMARFLRDK